MKKILVLLFIIITNIAIASSFPQNIEQKAKIALESELSKEQNLAHFEINEVLFIDMDRNAEYYFQGSWGQVLISGKIEVCTSEFLYTTAISNISQFLFLKRACN